ncbi:MAG: MATE family efflux transporter, partial [Myxococcota bacterium]
MFRGRKWREEFRALLKLGIPMGLTQLVGFSIATVDVLMIGRLGPDALAGASLGLVILYAVFLFGFGPAMAVSPMVSQALGADPNDTTSVRRAVRMALWTIGLGVAALSMVFFLAEEIALALGQP